MISQFIDYFNKNRFLLKPNYRLKLIPSSIGIVYGIVSSLYIFMYSMLFEADSYIVISFAVLFINLIGLADDIFGDATSKGFRGHITTFLKKGYMTTGFFKMLMIPIIVFVTVYYLIQNFILSFLYTLLTSLLINLFNLIDLRPGRCIKLFFVASMLLTPFIKWDLLSFSIAVLLLPVFIGDLKERYMLGDSGSNLIGYFFAFIATNKFSAVMNYGFYLSIFIPVLFLNIISEFISFSKFIDSNKILRFFDKLGRNN